MAEGEQGEDRTERKRLREREYEVRNGKRVEGKGKKEDEEEEEKEVVVKREEVGAHLHPGGSYFPSFHEGY